MSKPSWKRYCPSCRRFQYQSSEKCVGCNKPVKWADENRPPPRGPVYDKRPVN